MNKEFVTHNQALALKELGFDEPCLGYYKDMKGEKVLLYDTMDFDGECNTPLYQQAFRWFREKHNLFCEIQMDRTTEPKFCFVIFKYEHFGNYEKVEVDEWYLYRTYEEAEQACLDKLIEITNAEIKNRS